MSSTNDDAKSQSDSTTPTPSRGALLLALLQSIVVVIAVLFLGYTRLIFKRPRITEQGERARLAQSQSQPKHDLVPATLKFDETVINLALASETEPAKLHYLTVTFTMEITDDRKKEAIETLRPILLDRFLSLLGRKKMEEINHPQGRYLLRNQMMDTANDILSTYLTENHVIAPHSPPLVSNIHFTQFVVQ